MAPITYEPIGIIHTPFKEKADTPIQGIFDPESTGKVEVFPQYMDGLKHIDAFSHLILIYHFHLAEDCSLITRPFLDNEGKGIFSIRHFNRPNPIGISVVRLDQVKDNILKIGEVDILDGTPLLDIKPYMPDFDNRYDVRKGWYEHARNRRQYERNKGKPKHLKGF
jgi:tRNA-Thr(GGU) m(6)t(6)A37 methyltransferase TsaA